MDKRTSGDAEGAGIWGDSLGAISRKVCPGAFRGNPPVSLVPPVSLLVGFPEILAFARPRPQKQATTCELATGRESLNWPRCWPEQRGA